jgi:hypothetical protein
MAPRGRRRTEKFRKPERKTKIERKAWSLMLTHLPNPFIVDVTTDAVTNEFFRKADMCGGALVEHEEDNCVLKTSVE